MNPQAIKLLLAAFVGVMADAAIAAPDNITRGELSLLPPYCPETQTFSAEDARTSASGAQWRAMIGPTFSALHHYCWGLISVHRSKLPGTPALTRQGLLMSSINDFRYVLQAAAPNFPLLPEVYLRVGESQLELKAFGQASEAFALARESKPDYWPPYVRWADALVSLGKKADALAHLEQGLRIMPIERALIDAYGRLGGNFAKFSRTLAPAAEVGKKPSSGASEASSASASAGPNANANEPAASAAK